MIKALSSILWDRDIDLDYARFLTWSFSLQFRVPTDQVQEVQSIAESECKQNEQRTPRSKDWDGPLFHDSSYPMKTRWHVFEKKPHKDIECKVK